MPQPSAVTFRPEVVRRLSASEGESSFHERVLDGVRRFLEDQAVKGKSGPREFYDFEKELHARLMKAEREIVGDVMAASDVDADAIEIEGRVHRRVLRSAQTYMTAAGPVTVERWLYKDRRDPTAHALAALDRKLGILEGFWTTRAAEQASWVVTQMTPQKAEDLFERVGNMAPSKSSLDRLPRALGERWEAKREAYEQVLREAIVVPDGATSVAISIDGVLAPVDGGARPTEVRSDAAKEGRTSKGPAGYRELGCATMSFCDEKGDLISAIRFGRGPESKKRALKDTLRKDLAQVLAQRPWLKVAKITDAGGDNWEFTATLPEGPGDPRLLPRDRAPFRRDRFGPWGRHARDAAQVRSATRAPAARGPRRRGGHRRTCVSEACPSAQRNRQDDARLLPKESSPDALRKVEARGLHDRQRCRRSRVQDPRGPATQA